MWVTVGGDGVPLDRLDEALAPIHLDAAPVVVQARGTVSPSAAADRFAELLEAVPGRHARHQLGVDPFADGRLDTEALLAAVRRGSGLGVRALVVDATRYADQGAGDAAEIGLAVAAGIAVLRAAEEAGEDPLEVLRGLEFRLAVTDDQMVSVAKLRAARLVWSGALRAAGIETEHTAMRQHAVTARAMFTRYDAWTNLLRTTVAAFAAGIGGAESVTVLPFDIALGRPTPMARRMARNISTLLLEESHVAASADPAGGAYAVEELTDGLAAAAWDEVRRVEAAGGLDRALADGSVAERIARAARARTEQIRTRRRPITGVSEFPLVDEQLPEREPWGHPEPVLAWARDYERLRDDPASRPVLIATMGSIAEHTARAGFATNLCAAGGIPTVNAGATDGPDDAAAALRDAGTTVAILAGSDGQYVESGSDHVAALRAAGATWVVLAGRPVEELTDVVDGHIASGMDAVTACEDLRSHLEEGRRP